MRVARGVIIIGALFLSSLACAPTLELHIDRGCTVEHRALIREGVDRANAWVTAHTGEPAVELVGSTSVDLATAADFATDPLNDGVDTVVCFYTPPPQFEAMAALRGADLVGLSGVGGGDIWLFMFQPGMQKSKGVTAIISHELGHYIGIRPHIPGDTVMANPSQGVIEYTPEDTKLLCDVYKCHGNTEE